MSAGTRWVGLARSVDHNGILRTTDGVYPVHGREAKLYYHRPLGRGLTEWTNLLLARTSPGKSIAELRVKPRGNLKWILWSVRGLTEM